MPFVPLTYTCNSIFGHSPFLPYHFNLSTWFVHYSKGPFINYVDRILRIFYPSPFLDKFTYISLCSSAIKFWQIPLPLACLRSLWTAPNTKITLDLFCVFNICKAFFKIFIENPCEMNPIFLWIIFIRDTLNIDMHTRLSTYTWILSFLAFNFSISKQTWFKVLLNWYFMQKTRNCGHFLSNLVGLRCKNI